WLGLANAAPRPLLPLAYTLAGPPALARRLLDSRRGRRVRPRAVLVHVGERVEQRERPGPGCLAAPQVRAGGGVLRTRLLSQDVIGDLRAAVRVDPLGRERREVGQRLARELPDSRRGDAEGVGERVVASPAPDDELDNRLLFGRKLIEGRHGGAKG